MPDASRQALLQNIFLPKFIKVDLESCDKEEAFKELVKHYCDADNSLGYSDILDAILRRESKMSTGIQKGAAIPHGKTGAVKSLRGALGISQKGINYDALDGEPVHLLFMIISPLEDSQEYLLLLKHLADLLEDRQFKAELQAQTDSKAAFDVICKFEK